MMEVEVNGCFPFLDILLSIMVDGSTSHHVYCKKTHMEQHLHANSHHFPTQKFGVLNALATRAMRILDKDHLEE